jgi:tetratricopeptide (TPR) repeat protein
MAAVAAANAPPRAPSSPIALRVRRTLTNVRALPAWRRRVPPAIFIAVIALLVAGLVGAVASIRSRAAKPPVVDTTAELRRARERQLREEGNALLRQGRVTDAYAKYEELSRLAPRSPFVTTMMQKLSAIRQQEEISKAQVAQAKAKFDEGFALFNEKKYPDAIARFQESFSLNPSSNETAEYLKLAQAEQQKIDLARAARSRTSTAKTAGLPPAGTTTGAGTAGDGGPQPAASSAPAQLTTSFTHPFTDGRIIVRAGADIVANEQLFDERPRRMFRAATRVPRNINVTHSLPAKNADLQVWVTVPNAKVQEHHVLPSVRFQSGQTLRLTVRYEAASKRFTYEVH